MKTDPKGKSGDTLHYTEPQLPLCRATEDQGRDSLRSRCTVNNVEFRYKLMGGDIGEIQLGSERELYKYINHYAVVKKKSIVRLY